MRKQGRDDRDEREPRPRRSPVAWLVVLVAFLVLILVVPGINPWRRADPPAGSMPPSTASRPAAPKQTTVSVQDAQCDQIIHQGQELGLIRSRPRPERIDVDEKLWAIMDESEKRGLLLALRCSAYRGTPRAGEEAEAYGVPSGKRLALARAAGVTFE
jgi:hypothetical protein